MKFSSTLALILGVAIVAVAAGQDTGKETGAEKPGIEMAAPEKPAAENPAAEKPAAEKPAAEKPADEKPAAEKPAAEKPAAGSCDTNTKLSGKYYKDESSGKGLLGAWDCMKYHECVMGQDIVHHCFYLIPLKQYNPQTRSCEWFWKVNCHADDPAN